jgi:MHS family proline/betaine transporter-like MFS transporter
MQVNQIAKSSLGNILEWLDFGLVLFLAPVIGDIFFPFEHPELSKLAAFGVFAGGFLCRPIGGIIFGHYGDKFGRAKPLRFSILIITFSTFFIGLLPSHASSGIIAPILLTLLRLIQGVAIGGEYSGVMTYLVESAPLKRRGFIGSFAATGANLGFLLATIVILFLQYYFDNETIKNWAWRLPFILIGFIGAFISYYRFKLVETPVFEKLKKEKKIEAQPLLKALRTEPKSLLIIFCLNAMSSGFYYVFFGYMPEYLQNYIGISSKSAFSTELLTLIGMLIFVPIMGILGDRFSRKNMLLITSSCMIAFAFPMFYFLQLNSGFFIFLVLTFATLLSSMDQGNTLTMIVESSTGNIRYSSIAFSYNLSAAVFGGLSPIVVMTLIEKINLIAPGYYILFTALLGLIAVLLIPKGVSKKPIL